MKFKLYILLFTLSFQAFANELFLHNLDTGFTEIGGVKNLELVFEGQGEVKWPEFQDSISENLEFLHIGKIDTLNTTPIQIKQKLQVTSWDSGYFVFPPVKAICNSDTIQTNPILLNFASPQINIQNGPKPLANQWDTPFILDEILWIIYTIIGAGAGLAILILLIIKLIKYKRSKQPIEVVTPAKPLIQILKERLEKLETEKIWEQGQEKAFQVEITSILKQYLELDYQIDAIQHTSSEILKQLEFHELDFEKKKNIKFILNFSDMVKFAKQKGDYTQHENALRELKKYLNSYSKPIESK